MEPGRIRITAGMGQVIDYESLVKAGADEVFTGYVPDYFARRAGSVFQVNRREAVHYHVHPTSLSDMRILKDMRNFYGIPVVITLNALSYAPWELPLISDLVKELADLGFYEYIIADPGLALFLETEKLPLQIHFSGELGEYNSETVKLLKASLPHLKRIIFHRKNSLSQMQTCIEACAGELPEFEAFLMNEMCHFTGGFCNSLHCDELAHICRLPYRMVPVKTEEGLHTVSSEDDEEEISSEIGGDGCGLCGLYRMSRMGITHVKVVGRGKAADALAEDIKLAARVREMTAQKEADFYTEVRMLQKKVCGFQCYYRNL